MAARPTRPSPPALAQASAFALAALLAGCAGAPLPQAEPAEAPAPTGAAGAPSDAAELRMSGCTGWLVTPRAVGQRPSPRTPEGWAEDPPQPTATVMLLALDCGRVSVGPFERPLRLLVEWTSSFSAPASCTRGTDERTTFGVAATLWLEDAEVAAHFRDAFALDALVAPFEVAGQPAGAGQLHTWSWGLPGQPASHVDVTDAGPDHPQETLPDPRLFWSAAGGVGRLDLDLAVEGPAYAGLPATGSVQPPMLLHGDGPFAWTALWLNAGSAEGRFTTYEDLACATPLA